MWQRAATTSSLLPWNRNETKGGGPVRISAPSPPGQVHTHTHVHMHDDQARELSRSLHTRALWENSAGRTVSGLQGYPVSRANEPRELPYVLVRRKDRQGLPVVNGRPSFSRPVPIHFRAQRKSFDPPPPPLPWNFELFLLIRIFNLQYIHLFRRFFFQIKTFFLKLLDIFNW